MLSKKDFNFKDEIITFPKACFSENSLSFLGGHWYTANLFYLVTFHLLQNLWSMKQKLGHLVSTYKALLSFMTTLYLNLWKSIRAIEAIVLSVTKVMNENILVWKIAKDHLRDIHINYKAPGEVPRAATISYDYHQV